MSKVIELDNDIIIWGVVIGPFASQDLPEWEYGEVGRDQGLLSRGNVQVQKGSHER